MNLAEAKRVKAMYLRQRTDWGSFEAFLRATMPEPELTPAQWVLVRVVFDHAQPDELPREQRAIAKELFGLTGHIQPNARRIVAMLKGARIGGTMLWSIYLVYRAATAVVTGLGPGEEAFSVIVCPDLKLAKQAFRYCTGIVDTCEGLQTLQTRRTADSLSLRSKNGRIVTIECLPASEKGRATRGRTLLDCVMDEACFLRDPETGVVNDAEIYRSVAVRVKAGGKLGVVSTPWVRSGLLWDLYSHNWGAPKTAFAVRAPTLTMRRDADIATVVEDERRRDPDNARREYDCEPLTGDAASYFDGRMIVASIDESLVLPVLAPSAVREVAGDFGFLRDSSALCAVHRTAERYTVADLLELRPTDGPLKPSAVVDEFAKRMQDQQVEYMTADAHYRQAIAEYLMPFNFGLVCAPEGAKGKADTYAAARVVLHSGKMRLPKHPRFLRQLEETTVTPTAGGQLSIRQPRWTQGGHGDLVSAWVLATWQASRQLLEVATTSVSPDEQYREMRIEKRIRKQKRKDEWYD